MRAKSKMRKGGDESRRKTALKESDVDNFMIRKGLPCWKIQTKS